MGGGRWTGDVTRAAYAKSSAVASDAKDYREVFKSTTINNQLDPKGVMLRESCDGDDNPNSHAIILALDVTGSMGNIAHQIAKDGLGTLIEGIHERVPVPDPHIMFMAVGDANSDQAPLQVSEFEADLRLIEQLNNIYVEGNGGGNSFESYDLPWYFAGQRTTIDCFDKRGEKGYLFTMGDENPPEGLTASQIKTIFGSNEQQDVSAKQSLEMAQEKYNVFHLIIEQGSYCRGRGKEGVTSKWRNLLGKRAISLSEYKHMSQVILSIMDVNEGKDPEDVIASWEDADIQTSVRYSLGLSEQ